MPGKDRKRWTVLIYMVADDPQGGELLDQRAVQEMDQITAATLSLRDKNREYPYVAVQVDFRTLPGVWRRVIGESTFVRPESNAADSATLYGFFDWASAECPADHCLLIFWGHSRGQFGMFSDSDPFDYTAQTLTLEELGTALTAAKRSLQKPVDVIAFKDCFMANLEIAYELNGLADYLLASPGLVPVEGWPYENIFKALTGDVGLEAARGILKALEEYYQDKDKKGTKGPHKEVPYSLLSTAGAVPVVKALDAMLGKDRGSVDSADKNLRPSLEKAAQGPGDRALADLGQLVSNAATLRAIRTALRTAENTQNAANEQAPVTLDAFVKALGDAKPLGKGKAPENSRRKPIPEGRSRDSAPASDGLVVAHTGKEFGGVNVFLYPETPKDQRDSMLTRPADEKAYRRLAISQDTKWADIALGRMPLPQARPGQDVSKAIAVFEQLERMGGGLNRRTAARASAYLRRRARSARNPNPTEADFAEAAQYATIADLAGRLADFASDKPGADFASDKPGADFGSDKPGADFASDKPGADFGPG
jgi:hypothetical protein